MNGSRVVQHSMIQRDQKLVVAAPKFPLQRLIAGLDHDSFPYHLPKLFLGNPILFAVITNNQSRFFYTHNWAQSIIHEKQQFQSRRANNGINESRAGNVSFFVIRERSFPTFL
jgi:hypothetical protein